MTHYRPGTKIGYLGGGQLARMLSESASRLGLEPHVLSLSPEDPAAQVTAFWKKGNPNNYSSLTRFLKTVDVVTFESEFMDAKKLQQAQDLTGAKILPSPTIMGELQDRESQKALFDQHRLETAMWSSVTKKQDLFDFVEQVSLPIVLKKRFNGYDGYGTFVIKNKVQLGRFLKNEWQDGLFIAEKFIPFKRELAVMVGRSLDGSSTHFPFVQSQQVDARCDWVCGPLPEKNYGSILKKLKTFLKKIDYVGIMGVEFFETKQGELVINEIAPRVHNSGHYSQNTGGLSQFDVHNMCLLGLPLPKKIIVPSGFAMANLIGGGNKGMRFSPTPGFHWYGKAENRKGRKMGHINAVAPTPRKALSQVLKKRGGFKL